MEALKKQDDKLGFVRLTNQMIFSSYWILVSDPVPIGLWILNYIYFWFWIGIRSGGTGLGTGA